MHALVSMIKHLRAFLLFVVVIIVLIDYCGYTTAFVIALSCDYVYCECVACWQQFSIVSMIDLLFWYCLLKVIPCCKVFLERVEHIADCWSLNMYIQQQVCIILKCLIKKFGYFSSSFSKLLYPTIVDSFRKLIFLNIL